MSIDKLYVSNSQSVCECVPNEYYLPKWNEQYEKFRIFFFIRKFSIDDALQFCMRTK